MPKNDQPNSQVTDSAASQVQAPELANPADENLEKANLDMGETVEIPDTAVRAIVQIASRGYQGPIPDPESFERYENCLPGSADRILKMAEREQEARLAQEPIDKQREFFGRITGQIAGISSLILIVGCATAISLYCQTAGAYAVSAAMVAAPLLAHVERITNFFRKKDSK
jgi:uncharacterized membrane protein